MTMKTAARVEVNAVLRQEWLDTISDLQSQVKAWVGQEPDWTFTRQEDQAIEEEPLGRYSVAICKIQTPNGEVRLEPIARNYPGRGIVELFAWPTLYRVRLVRDDDWGGWRIRTDSGIFLRQEWNRMNFIMLVGDLIAASA